MNEVILFADPECWLFKKEYPFEFSHFGCGPGNFGNIFIPDTAWGLSIREACQIHDWGYRFSVISNEEDRHRHDRIFKYNCMRIIWGRTESRILTKLRFKRILIYFNMIRNYGGPAYWEGRNRPYELRVI